MVVDPVVDLAMEETRINSLASNKKRHIIRDYPKDKSNKKKINGNGGITSLER